MEYQIVLSNKNHTIIYPLYDYMWVNIKYRKSFWRRWKYLTVKSRDKCSCEKIVTFSNYEAASDFLMQIKNEKSFNPDKIFIGEPLV